MVKIALASRDGETINEHFGRAGFFRIYALHENGYEYLETRDVVDALAHRHQHGKTDFDRVVELLSDCDGIFVSRIGEAAAAVLLQQGIRVFEVNGTIDAILNKIINDGSFRGDEHGK